MGRKLTIYNHNFVELKDCIRNSKKYGINPGKLLVYDLKKRLQNDQNILKRRMTENDYNSSAYLFNKCNDIFKEIELFLENPNESRINEKHVIYLVDNCMNSVNEIYKMLNN